MDSTILQVPISKSLRDDAAKAATHLGFSSLQEIVRIFLMHLAKGRIKITFETIKNLDKLKL